MADEEFEMDSGMAEEGYLSWLVRSTPTRWWHDSGDPQEFLHALGDGATGVTTNPVLTFRSLQDNRTAWRREILEAIAGQKQAESRAIALTRLVASRIAALLRSEYERSAAASGYVCAQVDPDRAGDRQSMLAMAREFHSWAPNIMVKLPATAAGLDVLEECASEGIATASTVSFTVPQVLAAARRHRIGAQRASQSGVKPGKCLAVLMIGRLDDYLRDVAGDNGAELEESDIRQAGLAVTKRALAILQDWNSEVQVIVAALRGAYHMIELAGGGLLMSIHPKVQGLLSSGNNPREQRIRNEIPPQVIGRLMKLREFARAYEPDGMIPEEFIGYGATQRTLSQFSEMGWKRLETFEVE